MDKFISYEECDSQFNLKVLDSLGGLDPVGVLSCDLVRAFDIEFSIILPVYCGAHLSDFVKITRHFSLKFHSSRVIMLNCCTMTVDWS